MAEAGEIPAGGGGTKRPAPADSAAAAAAAAAKRQAREGDVTLAASAAGGIEEAEDHGAASGWVEGGAAQQIPLLEGVLAGELRLLTHRVLLRVPVRALRAAGGAVAVEGAVSRSNAATFFCRADLAALTEEERQHASGPPASSAIPQSSKSKKRRRAIDAGELPAGTVAVATTSPQLWRRALGANAALQLALLRLQARGYITVQCSVSASSLAALSDTLSVHCTVRLLPPAFAAADEAPDDHDTRNPELGLVLDALAARADAPATAAGGEGMAAAAAEAFSVHSFYETLRRTVHESPASAPTPTGMTCTLRPYQARAVAWMVSRETPGLRADQTTHPLWSELCLPGERTLWANSAIGRLSRREAWHQQSTAGGILAEEMGLGKTVEVIALIMSRPCLPANRLQVSTHEELQQQPAVAAGVSEGQGASIASVELALRPVARAVAELTKSPDAAAFLAPAVELFTPEEIPGYQDMIRHPMDLRTIEMKLRGGEYTSPEDVASDVRLVCWNCWQYNHKTTLAFQCAQRLSALFEKRYKAVVVDDTLSADVSMSERFLQGTLIIAPHSILQQWRDEITCHAPDLKVEVYSGLHSVTTFDEKGYAKTEDLTKMKATDDFAAEERREEKRQQRLLDLTKADIVLTTYQALRKEVHYASDFGSGGTRTLRHAKVYRMPTCPLLAFAWHRVVLDEAQMVESTTAAVATMALRIRARHRWCVTGTPVGARGVEDLHGLLVFLRHEPFNHAFWWERTLLKKVSNSPREGLQLLRRTLRPIMWRNSKAHVKDELGIPPMTQKLVKLELTTAEREIYNRILKGIRTAAKDGELAESELMQLRLACAHPQMTRFWSSLQTEGQVQGTQGGGTSLSMSEILERMITMAQQDMEKHERDLCKHLTHLALAWLKKPAAGGTSRKKKKKGKVARKSIRFADEDAAAVEAREAELQDATEEASNSDEDVGDGDDDGSGKSAAAAGPPQEPAQLALQELSKAVRVADDGLQVLQAGGLKQTQLETSAGALKSWRLVEIAMYRVLAEVFQRLDEELSPEALEAESVCECIVCTTAEKRVSHKRCKRRQCAIDLIPKKKTEIFEQPNSKQAELEHQLLGVRGHITKLCADGSIDCKWCRNTAHLAAPFATKDIGQIPGLRGLAGVAGTENPALEEALAPEKKELSIEKHKFDEMRRFLEVEQLIPFTEPLYNLLQKHHTTMVKQRSLPHAVHGPRSKFMVDDHREVMAQLLGLRLHMDHMIDCDLERQPGGSRVPDRARSATLTAAERRVFLRIERKEAFDTGNDLRDRSSLSDITVYEPPVSLAELSLERLGGEEKDSLETWSHYYTRQGRRYKAQSAAGVAAAATMAVVLAADDGSAVAAAAGRDLIASRRLNIGVCVAHYEVTEALKSQLFHASKEEIEAKVARKALCKAAAVVAVVIEEFGTSKVEVKSGAKAKPDSDSWSQGIKMLKYINENLRKTCRQLKDVKPLYEGIPAWARLSKHRQEVFRLNCRLHFLRQIDAEDRCARLVLMHGLKRGEVEKECDKAEACEEYRARLATITSAAGLAAEQQRLRQRAAKSEREGLKQLHHTKFLQTKHEEALKEASGGTAGGGTEDAGTLCPVCLQMVDEGLLMQCGHFFCTQCTDKLLAEPHATCAVCRKKISKRSLFRVSGQAAHSSGDGLEGDHDGRDDLMSIRVKGDFGTKVNALVRFLKHQALQHTRQEENIMSGGTAAIGVDDADAFTFDAAKPPKALVYSQWDTELVLVSKALAMNGISFVELKGSMQQRSASLHRFNVEPDVRVFLLATGVANAGLTLVAATSVFILEPSLNPAIEEQAINRIHRIGQTRPTTVYRFVVADSVEETILDLQAAKRGSLVRGGAGAGGSAAAAAAAGPDDGEDEEAAVRRWDVEGLERGVLLRLTDTILSPRKRGDGADGGGEEDDEEDGEED